MLDLGDISFHFIS